MDVAELNRLRNAMKAAWAGAGDKPPPQLLVRHEDAEDDIPAAGRTLASELGLRYIPLDLVSGLTDEHRTALARPGPRLVVVRNLGLTPPEGIEDLIRTGARSLILIELRLPDDQYAAFTEARRAA